MVSHWFSMVQPRQWPSDFLWRDHWLYVIIYVRIHTIDTNGCHKIRKYRKLHFIFSWTRSLIKPLVSLQWPNIIFQTQGAMCERTLRLNAAKDTEYIKKYFKQKWFRIKFPTKNSGSIFLSSSGVELGDSKDCHFWNIMYQNGKSRFT